MELRQLEYFVAVAEEANFTRAAQRVHISQSGVSAQIRQLERDVGAMLIDRSARTATLTSAGEAALEHARAVLASAAALRRAVDDVNDVLRGRIVVGMVTACTVTPLFEAIAAFHRAHPGIEIELIEHSSDRLVERVRAGTMDAALVGSAGAPPAGLDALPIISEGLVVAVPTGHPLARRTRVALAELRGHPIICLPEGTGIRAVLDQACAAAGVGLDIVLQASAPDAVLDLASRGLGVAILSASMVATKERDLRSITIDGVDLDAVLALVATPSQGPALRAFLACCREAFGLPGDRPPG